MPITPYAPVGADPRPPGTPSGGGPAAFTAAVREGATVEEVDQPAPTPVRAAAPAAATAPRHGASADVVLPRRPFRVLLVCTANHCRTPIVEHLMRRSTVLADAGWAVVSAGVASRGGRSMHELADRVLTERGIDTTGWVTRPLTAPLVAAADLVLAVDRATRHDVVTLVPVGLNRTFVLGHFARTAAEVSPLPPGDPRDVGRELVRRVVHARGRILPRDDDDLPDPVGHRVGRFRATADTVQSWVDELEAAYRPQD